MKKVINKIMLVAIIAIFITNFNIVNAVQDCDAILLPSETTVKRGETVSVTLTLDNIISDENGAIEHEEGIIEYDANVFEELTTNSDDQLNEAEELPGCEIPTFNTSTNKFVMLSSVNAKKDILKINFKVKDTAQLGETTITFKDLYFTDGETDINAGEVSVNINITSATTGGNGNTDDGDDPQTEPETPNYITNENGGRDYGSVEDLFEETGTLTYSTADKIPQDDGKDEGKEEPIVKTGDIIPIVAGIIIAVVVIANIVVYIVRKKKTKIN